MRRFAACAAVSLALALAAGPAVGHPGHAGQPEIDPTALQAQPDPPAEANSNDTVAIAVLVLLIVTAVALAGLREAGRRQAAS